MVQPDHECDFITNIVGSIYKNVLKIGFFRTGFLGGGKAWGPWGFCPADGARLVLRIFRRAIFGKRRKKAVPSSRDSRRKSENPGAHPIYFPVLSPVPLGGPFALGRNFSPVSSGRTS